MSAQQEGAWCVHVVCVCLGGGEERRGLLLLAELQRWDKCTAGISALPYQATLLRPAVTGRPRQGARLHCAAPWAVAPPARKHTLPCSTLQNIPAPALPRAADLMNELDRREKELGITPNPDVVAFMTASNKTGRQNFITDIVIRLLGLNICADTVVVSGAGGGFRSGRRRCCTSGRVARAPTPGLSWHGRWRVHECVARRVKRYIAGR